MEERKNERFYCAKECTRQFRVLIKLFAHFVHSELLLSKQFFGTPTDFEFRTRNQQCFESEPKIVYGVKIVVVNQHHFFRRETDPIVRRSNNSLDFRRNGVA